MLKKIFFLVSFSLIIFFLSGCSKDTVTNAPVITTQGILVLCEGDFSTPGDYSFINTKNDSVSNNVYSNSNSGATLGKFPDGMISSLSYLYITAQGQYGGPGKMYRLTQSDNKLVNTSIDFGTNPYDMVLTNNYFYITNTGGSTVSKLGLTLDVVNPSIQVGPNPSKIISALHSVYIAKQSFTTENSVAIINFFNDAVSKAYFPAPPVSVAFNEGVVYVSTYSHKKLYVLDSTTTNKIIDSIPINVPSTAIGEIVAGDYKTMYIVGIDDTTYGGYLGKKVYKLNLDTKQIDNSFLIQMTGNDDVFGIAYEGTVNNLIYIGNSRGGTVNGEVRAYTTSGTLLKTYTIGEKYPHKLIFKYGNN